jgi:mannitol/fructose-specific phosphotransferase system IIA component (Ntr-type)
MNATRSLVRSMKLRDVFPPEAVVLGLEGRDRDPVIAELVRRLADLGRIPAGQATALTEAIRARERAGTTALWQGMAMPNVRTSLTERFVGVLGIDRQGVAFGALGGEPVRVLFLLVAPLEEREAYFELLGKIAALGKGKSAVLQLAGCRSAEEVQQVLTDIDGR